MDRRTFLKTLGALALAPACGGGSFAPFDGVLLPPLPDGLAEDEDERRFPLGVQSGGTEADDIRLWGFTTVDRPHDLWTWRIDEDARVVDVARMTIEPDRHGYLRADLSGLQAGAVHFYAFGSSNGERRSAVGRFVTAPSDDDLRPLTIAGATCTSFKMQPWIALQRMAGFDFDLIAHLGDMAYCDRARDEDGYRRVWHRTLADPGYRALLPRAAKLHVWDDHEFWNNPDPERDPARIALGKNAFFENTAAHEGDDGRLWRSYRWGRTAEILLIDARTERKPSTMGRTDEYLSNAQLDFVLDRLKNSPARFKVLLNSLPVTRLPDLYPSADDRWQGYRTQRDRLLEVLEDDDAARGTLFLSGDFHIGFVARAESAGLHRRLVEIAVGPSGNQGNPFAEWPLRDLGMPGSQFEFATGRLNATFVKLDPATGEARVQFVDAETGLVLHDDVLTPGV